MNKMGKIRDIMIPVIMIGSITIQAVLIQRSEDSKKNAPYMVPRQDRLAIAQCYDVNRDGLKDIIEKDGKISLQQKDGTYLSLQEAFEADNNRLRDSYSLEADSDGKYHTKGLVYLTE